MKSEQPTAPRITSKTILNSSVVDGPQDCPFAPISTIRPSWAPEGAFFLTFRTRYGKYSCKEAATVRCNLLAIYEDLDEWEDGLRTV
jgi:hypothetical protein